MIVGSRRPTISKKEGMDTSYKITMRCKKCGHKQPVTAIPGKDGLTRLSSAADWCNGCNTSSRMEVVKTIWPSLPTAVSLSIIVICIAAIAWMAIT